MMRFGLLLTLQVSLALAPLAGEMYQEAAPAGPQLLAAATTPQASPTYVLGSDDVIAIRAMNAEEIGSTALRIDPGGHISLPMLGRVMAAGLTIEGLERELASRLELYVKNPVVAVTVVEYRSQPVSVIGAVGQSGVHQLEGRKTLIEILAKAGGLRPDAGNVIKITRKAEWGTIPLPSAVRDPSGEFSIAEVRLKGILQASSPEENIQILPFDVISVPRGELVYVIGEVKNPGGFVLNERGTLSGLQALAMADGFTTDASPNKAMIVRPSPDGKHVQIATNLSDIINGRKNDVTLQPDDILVVPNNVARSALGRIAQTAISATTAVTIRRVLW